MKNLILALLVSVLLSGCAVGFNDGYYRGTIYVPPPDVYYYGGPYYYGHGRGYGHFYGPRFHYGPRAPYFRPHYYYR